jgi:two-component system, response regulator YesN
MPFNILLVDDNKEFREEIRDCFYEFKITDASNGEQALEILKKPNVFDMVLLDVKMPGLSGTKILKEIKKINPDIIIIIMTGYSSKDIVIEALKGHADDYIEKPINVDKTKNLINSLLNAKEKNLDNNLENIDDKLNYVKHYIERNYDKKISLNDAAREVYLSPKYLSRIFKENTGMKFNDYKLSVKINKAKEMLENKSHNINEISFEMGYQNTESFIKIFKKFTGYTPTEYNNNK